MSTDTREALAADTDCRDWCTDPNNCQRCKASQTEQIKHVHAGIPVGPQRTSDLLPPLPEASHNPRGWSYTAEQMQAYARAALAIQPAQPKKKSGYARVPLHMTAEMKRVTDQEDWRWEDLLAAAEAITLKQYDEIAAQPSAQGEAVSDAAILEAATKLFPMWREDIQPRFVVEVCRAALALASAPAAPAHACVTEEMVTAYLTANDAYWKRIDGEPTKLGKWRNGTPSEATRVSLMAALAAAPAAPAQAVPCPNCRGEGTVRAMTQEHGPDDYEFDMVCPMCSGGQEAPAAQPSAQGEAVATVHGWVNPAPHAAQPMVPSPSFTVRIGASAPAAPAQAVPLTDEHVNAVVRSVQPYLSTDCKAWRELTETCRYWLQAERGIAPKAAQGR